MIKVGQEADVICQHSRDGTIIPLKIRLTDEDGEQQQFSIKGYKDMSGQGTRMTPDGVYVTDNSRIFYCNIIVFGVERRIHLYYEPSNMRWKVTV